MNKAKLGCLSLIFLLIAGIAFVVIVDRFVPSKAIRKLPRDATEIQEYYYDYGFIGDFVRQVKAKAPRESVDAYAKKVGAVDFSGGETKLKHSFSSGEDWWTPSSEPIYFKKDGNFVVLVGWDNGYIYFEARAW